MALKIGSLYADAWLSKGSSYANAGVAAPYCTRSAPVTLRAALAGPSSSRHRSALVCLASPSPSAGQTRAYPPSSTPLVSATVVLEHGLALKLDDKVGWANKAASLSVSGRHLDVPNALATVRSLTNEYLAKFAASSPLQFYDERV
jgi:hypothetical protein